MSLSEKVIEVLVEGQNQVISDFNREQAEVLKNSVVQAINKYTVSNSIGTFYLLKNEIERTYFTDLKARSKNQTKAAETAGLNRGTLRKKYAEYGLL